MSSHFNQGSRLIRLVCWLVVAGLVLSFALSTGAAQAASGGSKLSKHNRELLAEAVAQGKSTVTVLIAAKPGANKSVASGIASLGGTVRYRDDDVSYIRATVPTGKVEAAAALSGVQALNLDEIIPLDDPRPAGAVNPTPQTPPSASTPNNNPYMPIGDTGASQFMAAHPTWDGRGVTVGI